MQNTELDHQSKDLRNAHSNDDGPKPTQTIVRFLSRTNAVLMLAALACALPARSQQAIVAFDPPGSVSTIVNGISTSGLITGGYTDSNTNYHGFLRTQDGQFTTWDAPGALTYAPYGIAVTAAGVITGTYYRYGGELPGGWIWVLSSGFLRNPDGTFFNIDPPNTYQSYTWGINNQGTVVGSYWTDGGFAGQFYLRTADGTFTPFDPEPGTSPWTIAINPAGTIVGSYFDTNFISHSFLRTARGTVTLFGHPDGVNGTVATSISPNGSITGDYIDANYNTHGFVLNQTAQFTTFDPEGSISTTPCIGSGNAPNGMIVGTYLDTNYINHGFVRASNGKITTFDPEGSVNTFVAGINPGGLLTGYFQDTNSIYHGFVFQTKVD